MNLLHPFGASHIHSNAVDPLPLSLTPHVLIESRQNNVNTQRNRARQTQLSQAERIVKRRCVDYKAAELDYNVAVSISTVDMGRMIQGQKDNISAGK